MIDTSEKGSKQLREAKNATLASQAEYHRGRAKVARLIANQEEEAAEKIHARIGHNKGESHSSDFTKQKLTIKKSSNKKPKPLNDKVSPKSKQISPSQKQSPLKTSSTKKPTKSSPKPSAKLTKRKKPKRIKKRKSGLQIFAERITDWLGRRPPWVVSLATHGMLLLVLGLLTMATFQEEPFVLTATLAERDDWAPEVPLVQLASWEESVVDPSDSLPELIELEAPAEMPTIEPITSFVETEVPYVSDLAPAASLMTSEVTTQKQSEGTPLDSQESGSSEAIDGKVEFFGVTEQASRIVFVVDNSGSMQRGRMETTLDELNRAVQRLKPEQKFYVIFYSDQAYPMYYPESVESLQFATRDNKKKLAKWLHTVEICLGGRLLDAVEMASGFDPQVVFLMSDGDIRSQRVMQSLTNVEAWDFTIHTFGMEVRTKLHADNLLAIAEANNGYFNVVDVRPKAIRRSMAKPIPYNRQPGEVWGSMVTPWN